MIKKIPLDKVKIIKEIGHGIMGTVYLVSYNGNKYALKIEHVLEEDLYDATSPVWNEITFAEDLANSNREHFMTLHNYDFVKDCKLKQESSPNLQFFPPGKQKYLKLLADSPYCVRKIYSLVDNTLDKIKLKTKEENYSMIIQILYIIYLMRKKGYVHADFHRGNIGVVNTKKKYIEIMGHKIPTFGRIYQAIDYGSVLNKNTLNPKRHLQGLPETQLDVFKWAEVDDKLGFMLGLVDANDFWDYVDQKGLQIDQNTNKIKVAKAPEIKFIQGLVDDDNLAFEFFRIVFPGLFQKIVLGKNFDKVRKWKYKVPLEDLIMFFLHFEQTKLLIDYFISRLD